jgi:hypothetical protein
MFPLSYSLLEAALCGAVSPTRRANIHSQLGCILADRVATAEQTKRIAAICAKAPALVIRLQHGEIAVHN